MPEASSLVAWLNSVGSGEIDSLTDLKTGRYLVICLTTIDPECEIEVDSQDDFWQPLLDYLSKSYDCDLKRCVDLCKLEEGEEEHIGRITVLLLCHAVQCSAREATINGITQLDTDVQVDIKGFIEDGLAAISSHTLEAGMFRSGIDGIDKSSTVATATPVHRPTIDQLQFSPVSSTASSSLPNPLVFCTPSSVRLPRRQTRTILDTPAALHWLGSPSSSVHSNQSASEVLRQVQFKLSISEKALAQERQLCEELSSELAHKIGQVDQLGFKHKSELLAQQKLHEQAMRDLEDELVHLRQKIVSFESNETKLQRQLASLKEEHNKKLEDGIQREKLQQQQVDQLSSLMTEQAAQLQLVGVRLQAAEAEVHTKSEVISKLECCQEEHEAARQSLLSKQQQLESTHRAEVEEMRTAMETLTTNLASYQTKYSESQQALRQCQEEHSAQLTALQETHTTTHESEMTSLREQLDSTQSANTELQQLLDQTREKLETATEKEQTQHQSIIEFTDVVSEQKAQLQQLEEKLTEVKKSSDEAMQQCKEEHAAQLAALQETHITTHESEITNLREQLDSTQSANTELQQLLDQATQKLEEITEKQNTQQQNVVELASIVDQQKTQVQTLQERLDEFKMSNKKKSEVISKLEYCQEEHEAAKQFLLSKQQQLESTHRAEVEEMRTAMETLTTNLASYQTKYEEAKEALLHLEQKHTAHLSEIREQNQSSAAILDLRSNKMSELCQQLSDLEEQQQPLVKELEKARAMHDQYAMQVQEADTRYNLLDDEYQRMCKDKAKADTKLLRLTAEKQSLETQLEYASHQLRELGKSSKSSPSCRPGSSRKVTRSSPRLLSASSLVEDEDPQMRVSELQWRNAQRLPHLRSSYPVEMQVQPESPSISDESVKFLQPSITSRSISHETSSSSSIIGQKRSADNQPLETDVLVFSPVKKPTTKCQLALKRTRVTSAHSNAGSGLQLRSYLDSSSPRKNLGRENSTAFEVAFSPPKKRTKMPARLREKEARPLTSNKQTVTKKPPTAAVTHHTTTKTRRGATALRSVNN